MVLRTIWENHVRAKQGSATNANENHNFANNIDETLGKKPPSTEPFKH